MRDVPVRGERWVSRRDPERVVSVLEVYGWYTGGGVVDYVLVRSVGSGRRWSVTVESLVRNYRRVGRDDG